MKIYGTKTVLIEILIDGAYDSTPGASYPTRIISPSESQTTINNPTAPTHFFPSNSASFIDQNQAYTH